MKTSTNGINLIKQFEGCRLKAYKPIAAEKYYTIGYGHYGPDVSANMTITQAQADAFLVADLGKFENYVTATGLTLTQNQFDALVSFTYNCGPGNLAKLIKGRDYQQIADAMLLYNKGANKQVLAGLVKRRQAERALFLTGGVDVIQKTEQNVPKTEPKNGNPYSEPKKNVRMGSKGNDVRWLQYELNKRWYKLTVDGIAGNKTISALIDYQKQHGLTPDGICGPKTIASLKRS